MIELKKGDEVLFERDNGPRGSGHVIYEVPPNGWLIETPNGGTVSVRTDQIKEVRNATG